jgi:hypothetical protein
MNLQLIGRHIKRTMSAKRNAMTRGPFAGNLAGNGILSQNNAANAKHIGQIPVDCVTQIKRMSGSARECWAGNQNSLSHFR